MRILSFKPGHDGQVAYLKDGNLEFSIEGEKDSWPRHEVVTCDLFLRCLDKVGAAPDVAALSGWIKGQFAANPTAQGGYYGETESTIVDREQSAFGRRVRYFSSSHERSHLLCAYGMSPFPQGVACNALVWEGNIGAFYRIDEQVGIRKIGQVMEEPGNKYAFLYALADPTFIRRPGSFRFEDAGKLMALAAFGRGGAPSGAERELINDLLAHPAILVGLDKASLAANRFFNIGLDDQAFRDLARKFSDAIFERFYRFAEKHLDRSLPLLVSGGCGLNCDWNTAWARSGLFPAVFVPPCANDSGSAVGTAIDAQRHYTGNAKISWTAYAGEKFEIDAADLHGIASRPLAHDEVAAFLLADRVIAWVQGRYEMGPRALGNRSLLAAPFSAATHARLNAIKEREDFRPIAPVCMAEEVDEHFEAFGPNPHMLFFQKVRTPKLRAVTHVDGTARVQSVTAQENGPLHALLSSFKARTGCGVLCNTSLNFKGKGFINRMSDLLAYARARGLDGFVVHDRFYIITQSA
jgi:predicted NodU family carbamoyl transferase